MYNPLEYDLVKLERQRRATEARRYVVRATRPRVARERTPAAARTRALWCAVVDRFDGTLQVLHLREACGCEAGVQRAR
jgi:hypothetical protein